MTADSSESFNPLGDYLYAFKFTLAANGQPQFVLAGKSNITLNGRSTPTITSYFGKPGTGIVRILCCFHAIISAILVNGNPIDTSLRSGSQMSIVDLPLSKLFPATEYLNKLLYLRLGTWRGFIGLLLVMGGCMLLVRRVSLLLVVVDGMCAKHDDCEYQG